jgi:hypothetical protein
MSLTPKQPSGSAHCTSSIPVAYSAVMPTTNATRTSRRLYYVAYAIATPSTADAATCSSFSRHGPAAGRWGGVWVSTSEKYAMASATATTPA